MDEWNNSCYGGICDDNGTPDDDTDDIFTEGTAAKTFEGMRLDLGYNIGSILGDGCDLTLWTRMTSWDSNSKRDNSESVGEVRKSLFGVTWKPKNNISFKMTMGTKDVEWTDDTLGAQSKSYDVMNLGIGYMF